MPRNLSLDPLYDPKEQNWTGFKTKQDLKDIIEFARPSSSIADDITIKVANHQLAVKEGGIGTQHLADGAVTKDKLSDDLKGFLDELSERPTATANAVVQHAGWTTTSGNPQHVVDGDRNTVFTCTQTVGVAVPGFVTSSVTILFEKEITCLMAITAILSWSVPAQTSAEYYLEFFSDNNLVHVFYNTWSNQFSDILTHIPLVFKGTTLKIQLRSRGTSARTFTLGLSDISTY